MSFARPLLCAALLTVVIGGAGAARAFERARSEYGALWTWPTDEVTVSIDARFSFAEREAVKRAMATWSAAPCTRFKLVLVDCTRA
jgi:hypothetical protein